MQYPDGVREVAEREPIYNRLTNLSFAPTALTNMYYMPSILLAEQTMKNPQGVNTVTKEMTAVAKSLILSTAALQAGGDVERQQAMCQYVERTWPAYEAKMLQKPEFAKWLIDGGVLFSFLMYSFYVEVDGFLGFDKELRSLIDPVTTYQMDVAFGEYHDVYGRPVSFVENDHVIYWHCMNNALWRGVRWRAPFFNYYLCQAGEGAHVVDLCSGALNTEKRFAYLGRGLNQKIVAYDKDPNISRVLPYFFGESIEAYGISFRCDDYFCAFDDPELWGKQDYVLMQGGMSYHVPQTEETLRGARKLLKKSASGERPKRFVFEVEVASMEMKQAVLVLGLQDQNETMVPDMSVDLAKERVKKAVNNVGGFEIEAIFDDTGFCGEGVAPTTVLFVLKAV